MRIDRVPLLSNPKLHYRLDPGEPGFATRATASRSTQLVTAQELRNRVRLQRQAIAEGRQVILAHSKFTHGKDGAFSTLRGGLTIVASIDRSASSEKLVRSGEESEKKEAGAAQGDAAKKPDEIAAGRQSTQEIQEEKRRISLELSEAQEELAAGERTDAGGAPTEGVRLGGEASTARLRYEIAELRRAKAKVEAQELLSQLAKLQATVEEAAAQSQDHVLGLIGAPSDPPASAARASENGSAGFSPGGMIRAHAPAGLFNALV